ncbi:MAG: FHA domain-containing protein [Gammaproteobacteria bacterium]|nr:FHA domain-containing protein [Gammaproteobacteria bacterium]NNF50114.1 FHA domain-containing protein [Woeseiaceae bacterium]MBT8095286.1 FHA domain-containing protein [Gammaproteobacteria bacterium]MBT8106261.1 FHA domain-containing protein [Gammaproteobacteria bacterium]NNK26275.1 FHA domain-containing protein [Woeseiaceae bacterium]
MRNALEDPTVDDSCLEFFGLEQPPFACLNETQPIFHAEQYALLEMHLADMMNETDRLFVLRGPDGSGKTTLLRRYLGGLENASIALIDESCKDGTEFYCVFLEQMGFQDITGKLTELRTITREFLVHRATASDHVLLVLDNASRIRPAVLEQLRWISGIRRDQRRVLSVVIAGNSGLDRILESPAMSGLRYENNVNFTIRAFTNDETAGYIRHRLEVTGCEDTIQFTAEACDLVHQHSGGMPKTINQIGRLLLAEAAARQTHLIDGALMRDIAQAENLPVNVVPLMRGRRKTDTGPVTEAEPVVKTEPAADIDLTPQSPAAAVEELLERIAQLTARVGELEKEKKEAGERLDSRETRGRELRAALNAREQAAAELAQKLKDRDEEIRDRDLVIKDRNVEIRDRDVEIRDRDVEIRQLRERLDDSKYALKSSVDDARELAARCNEEERAAASARKEATRALRKVEKLEKTKANLQERTKGLRAGLREASKKARQLGKLESALEKSEAKRAELLESVSRLEELRSELAAKNATIDELRDRLAGLENEHTKVWKALPADMGEPESPESDEDIAPIVAFDIIRGGKIERVLDAATAKPRMMIGREEDSDLRLESDFVSRHHALLFCSPVECHIEDLNSSNGTHINGKAVTRCRLKPDQLLVIGDYILRPRAANN